MLITLAIIGVVAALTIPTVVAKYQKKQYYSQFMKTYNTLSNAISLAVAENGTPDTWGDMSMGIAEKKIEKNIIPYLKVSKKITESDSELEYSVTLLSGEKQYDNYGEMSDNKVYWDDRATYLLDDGSIVEITAMNGGLDDENNALTISFDTNGLKGPNTYGRDLFEVGFDYVKIDGKYILVPSVMVTSTYASDFSSVSYALKSKETVEDELINDVEGNNCNPEIEESSGFGCAARLLLEGKMNY